MRLIVIGVLSLLVTSCATVKEQSADSDASKIKTQCAAFFDACKNQDFDTAKLMLAKMTAQASEEYVTGRLQKYGRLSMFDETKMGAIKIVNGKAVIAYWESSTDLDPLYFSREDGTWKILLPLTKYEHWCFEWSAADLASFSILKNWFEEFSENEL